MTSDNTAHLVGVIVAEQLGIAEEEVQPQLTFRGDLGADSLDLLEVVMSIEEEFEIDISSEDVDGLQTVADLITFIEERAA